MRAYFHDDVKQVRMAILIGSFLPLVCYLAWEAAIFGAIPYSGTLGLERLMSSNQPVTGLVQSISHYMPAHIVVILTKLFTSICVLTAFVCVSLSLSDYLADGFRLDKDSYEHIIVLLATFVPPLFIAVFYPRAFIMFLSIAGLCCVLLQSIMPAMMAWHVRYTKPHVQTYQVWGGKLSLILSMILSAIIIVISAFYLF
jgi:tyrosine-specific transport protein